MTHKNSLLNVGIFFIFIALVFITASVGGYFTSQSVNTWYQDLNKPVFQPPDWLFGPVWTTLYFLIAVSGYLFWLKVGWKQGLKPLLIYVLQLFLNALWTYIFFTKQQVFLAVIEIICLWICVLVCIWFFYRRSRSAGLLLIPYLLWLTFAVVLNAAIYSLNS